MATFHLGFDDTDSSVKGCTTYTAALLVEQLSHLGADFVDYPNLIRLNPNVPWKTRGNGALCLRFRLTTPSVTPVFERIIDIVEQTSDLASPTTHPGIVLYRGNDIPLTLTQFARNTIRGIVTIEAAVNMIQHYSCNAVGYKKQRGLIGAVAAIGDSLRDDHTYELIAYRVPANIGTPRQVNYDSVVTMDQCPHIHTFNNIDYAKKRILIAPRGPDPVLVGIRGDSALDVYNAFQMIQIDEDIERWMIFRTNQGTDAHFPDVSMICSAQPYHPLAIQGCVTHPPQLVPGRHVIFQIRDASGELDCAAYEPTKKFRNIIRQLHPGDRIRVYGAIRAPSPCLPTTLNVEKLEILELMPDVMYRNPPCKQCGKRLTSMGHRKGFRCKKCHVRDRDAQKIVVSKARTLSTGVYLPPLSAHRHLTKPVSRYGSEKSTSSVVNLTLFWAVIS
jgi:tRNA(Ile2)-agmatinylcytidine synthase